MDHLYSWSIVSKVRGDSKSRVRHDPRPDLIWLSPVMQLLPDSWPKNPRMRRPDCSCVLYFLSIIRECLKDAAGTGGARGHGAGGRGRGQAAAPQSSRARRAARTPWRTESEQMCAPRDKSRTHPKTPANHRWQCFFLFNRVLFYLFLVL